MGAIGVDEFDPGMIRISPLSGAIGRLARTVNLAQSGNHGAL